MHATRIFTNIQRIIYDNDIIKKAGSQKKRQRKTHKQEITYTASVINCKSFEQTQTNTHRTKQNYIGRQTTQENTVVDVEKRKYTCKEKKIYKKGRYADTYEHKKYTKQTSI